MIKFFRKIRQRLITENKVSKYLLYAIGEIVLVVIGILIALQINNWNESKKERASIRTSLTSLKVNLNEDIKDLNKQIEHNQRLLKHIDFAFKVIASPEYENKPLSVLSDSIGDLASERTFLPNNTTFKSMESGSHFQWIKDQEFKESIYRYYVFLDKFSSIVEQNNMFVTQRVEDFIYNKMELGTYFPELNRHSINRDLSMDNTNLIRGDPALENTLIGRMLRANGEISMSQEAIVEANKLIDIIDNYLKTNL